MPRTTARDKISRDAGIVADRARGLTWRLIGQRHDLTPRQCQTVWREHLAAEPLTLVDPTEAMKEAIEQLNAAIEDCALLAESTPNDSVRLGAIRTRLVAMESKFELMRLGGLIPHDLRVVRTQRELDMMAREFGQVLSRHQVANVVVEDLLSCIDKCRTTNAADERSSTS